jgi:HEAT repeat protein
VKVRSFSGELLNKVGKRVAIPLMLGLLKDYDSRVRAEAVRALGEQGERVPMEVLVGALSDDAGSVRVGAIKILQQRSPDSLSLIVAEAIAVLEKRPAGFILGSLLQGSFLDIIQRSGYTSPLVLAKVTELLDWPHWQVRKKACETLDELRRNIPDAAITRLLALRRDPDPLMKSVRRAADDALAEILSLEDGIEGE